MKEFLFDHGANPWNYLPKPEIARHLQAIASGKTIGVVAEMDGQLAGFATCGQTSAFSRYEDSASPNARHGHISEAVVAPETRGKGIGAALLQQCVRQLAKAGITTVYVERHEENKASAAMMRKAGFEIIDTFPDHARRTNGSRRTAVSRYETQPESGETR